jgi:DNA processing protein
LALAPERCSALLDPTDLPASLAATLGLKAWGEEPSSERFAALAQKGWRALPRSSEHFPEPLRALPDPPPMLWVRGDLCALDAPLIAIVGARSATQYGEQTAHRLARTLVQNGAVVVSGLARGIDAAAHRGALMGALTGARTVAVLGHGPDFLYPAANRPLAEEIARGGALISEFPPGLGPRKAFFPLRNRIISGLCLAVVVVEGRRRSGSLVTARHGLAQGREVLAVPGPVDVATSEGPNELLRDGAAVALDASDVLRACGLGPASTRADEEGDPLVAAIGAGPATIDELARRLKRDASEISRRIVEMELEGRVALGEDGRIYRRD